MDAIILKNRTGEIWYAPALTNPVTWIIFNSRFDENQKIIHDVFLISYNTAEVCTWTEQSAAVFLESKFALKLC